MRLDGWEVRLAEAVDAARTMPFSWGKHDCATWAFDVRAVLTGTPRPAWSYKTDKAGRRWMKRQGWGSFAEAGTAILGEPIAPLMAQRGDIVLTGEDPAFGVCVGGHAAFVAPVGLTFLQLRECSMAWRI